MEEAFGDELKPEHRSALDSHLAACSDCRASWDEFRLLRRGLDALAAEDDGPSPFVEAKILRAAAARHAERPSGIWRWLLRPATVGFATLALIAGLGYLGREELLRHRRPDDLTAPVPPPAPVSAPAPQAVPTQAGDSSSATAPAPAKPLAPPPPPAKKPEVDSKLKYQAEKPASAGEGGVLQQPAPAEEKASAVSAPTLDSAPAGGSGAAMKDGSDLKNEGRAREANIPEAEYAAPEASRQEVQKKSAEPKEAEQAPAKALQRTAPQPGAPSAPSGLAGPAADKTDTGLGNAQAQKELRDDERFNSLLKAAKAKIQRQDYAGALDDLLAAQKLRDNKEIQDLILLCRSHLRGDG